MQTYVIGGRTLDATAGAAHSIFSPSVRVRIRQITLSVTNNLETDSKLHVQVSAGAAITTPVGGAIVSAPSGVLAEVSLNTLITTSGISNSFANLVVPCDVTIPAGGSVNLFAEGTSTSFDATILLQTAE